MHAASEAQIPILETLPDTGLIASWMQKQSINQ